MEIPKITIGTTEYELLFTLKAAKEIMKKYGELENIAEKLYEAESLGSLIDDMTWLIMMLANQGILQYNYYHKECPKALLTQEEVELFCNPANFLSFKEGIVAAIVYGTGRAVQGGENLKNQAGA